MPHPCNATFMLEEFEYSLWSVWNYVSGTFRQRKNIFRKALFAKCFPSTQKCQCFSNYSSLKSIFKKHCFFLKQINVNGRPNCVNKSCIFKFLWCSLDGALRLRQPTCLYLLSIVSGTKTELYMF